MSLLSTRVDKQNYLYFGRPENEDTNEIFLIHLLAKSSEKLNTYLHSYFST